MSKVKYALRYGVPGLLIILGFLVFQNCGGPNTSSSVFLSPSGSGNNSTASFSSPYPGVPNETFQNCYTASPTDSNALSTCLNSGAINGAAFTSQAISNCFTAGNTSALYLALCLSQNGQVVLSYRPPKQFDIDQCYAAVGESAIAACLGKHGVDLGIDQAEIDQCYNAVGESSIEKCMHNNNFIPTEPILMQYDSNLCEKVIGGTANLALCLQNAELIPTTVTQTIINTCVTNVTDAFVVRCLRTGYQIPNVLMQYHINFCNTAVGPTSIATCLDKNGVLPIDPTSTLTSTQIAAYLQNDINACIAAVGVTDVAQCLRKRGIISNEVMQQHIDSCFSVAGVNAYNCLAANFAVLPTALTSTVLQACFTKNGNSSMNAAKCLASQGILATAPFQVHISECARLAGVDADATGTKPLEVGIAGCLNQSDLLATPLVQADIDACVTAAGLANVATCLNNKGYVPSYSNLISPGGIFGANCVKCHNAADLNGNMNISSYASVLNKIVPGDAADSTLYKEVDSGAMPKGAPMLSATFISTIALWINQGANDDVDVPPTAASLLPAGTIIGNLTGGGGNAAAFDGNISQTAANSAEAAAVGGFIGSNFGATTPRTVVNWWIWGSTDLCYNNPNVNGATVLNLQYSDDGVTYTTVDTVTTTATCTGPEPIRRNLPGPNMSHQYWRVMQGAGSKGDMIVGQLQFYGY